MKLLALAIAIGLWAYVNTQGILKRRVELPLEWVHVPSGFVLDPAARTQISAVLVGRRESMVGLDTKGLVAVADLRQRSAGVREFLISPQVQGLPRGVTADVSPVTVKLVPLLPAPTPSPP